MDTVFATITPTNLDAGLNMALVRDHIRSLPRLFRLAQFVRRSTGARDGYQYVLYLGQAHNKKTGWVFGTGDWSRDPDCGCVNLYVGPFLLGSHRQNGVFQFDSYGRFYIRAHHDNVKVDGVPLRAGQLRILENSNHLEIGRLSYKFEFNLQPAERAMFATAKNQYLAERDGSDMATDLISSATPSRNDLKIGDWFVHGIVRKIAPDNTVVQGASHVMTGALVTVKHLVRDATTHASISSEIKIYRELLALQNRRGARHIMSIQEVLYSSDQPEWTGSTDSVYIMWQPLVKCTFQPLAAHLGEVGVSRPTKITLFAQIAMALSIVHDHGWLHRDLRPDNMYIVSVDPPWAVLGEFSQAIEQRSASGEDDVDMSADGWKAPEIVSGGAHSYATDIFGLGAVAAYMFIPGGHPWMDYPNDHVEGDRYLTLLETFLSRLNKMSTPSADLIRGTLSRDPKSRMSMQQVISHPAIVTQVASIR